MSHVDGFEKRADTNPDGGGGTGEVVPGSRARARMAMRPRLATEDVEKARTAVSPKRWMALLVAVLAVLCYANILRGQFVFDDVLLIVDNDVIKDPRNAWKLFSTNLWGLIGQRSNYYRPLPPLVFMLLHAAFGLRPEPFHWVSLVLHAGTSVLVFEITRTLLAHADGGRSRWPALAGAALFAAHPVHVEAVAWISGLMDVSCAFFSLLAIQLYVTDSRDGRIGRAWWSAGALLIALLCKEPAAVVPVALAAHDVLFRRERVNAVGRAMRHLGPSVAVLLFYLSVRAYVLGGMAPVRHQYETTWSEWALTVPFLFAYYVQMLVLPVGQSVLHQLEPVIEPTSSRFLSALVIIAVFCAVAWRSVRAGRTAAFGTFVFVLTLAPSLYVAALGQDRSLVFAERYLYLPSAGAAMVLSAGIAPLTARRTRRSWLIAVGLSTAIAVGAVATVRRNEIWRDNITLWSDCIQKSPTLGVAHESLGLALIERGQIEAGGRELQLALRLDPDVARRYLNYGVFAAKNGLVVQAIQAFETALKYEPDLVEAHYSLAVAMEQMGWSSKAVEEYRATLRLAPAHADAHNNLGIALVQASQLDEAIDQFRAAVQARPHDPELRLNLAHAYEMRGFGGDAQRERALAAQDRSAAREAGGRASSAQGAR